VIERFRRYRWGAVLLLAIIPVGLLASGSVTGGSEVNQFHLDGASLSVFWALPFIGILLSIAIFPLVTPQFWHHNFGKISFLWALLVMIPLFFVFGSSVATYNLLHTALLEYIPFIILLLSLFTISGGVCLTGTMVGTPLVNTLVILVGTILASWMGTTGAAMLLIRPLIRANKDRQYKVHTVVFFIFLVANIGGSLTPLGDPPLFLGFLKGVDFFWTTGAMLLPLLFIATCLFIVYFLLDSYYYRKEGPLPVRQAENNEKFALKGKINLLLLLGVIGSVLMSGLWQPGIHYTVYHVELELQNIIRDVLLLVLTIISVKVTSREIRSENEFTWFPIVEVAKLFAGIFVTIIPAIAILRAGADGALSAVIKSVTNQGEPVNYMYFWATGTLSSFLDNAPTYLVFFNTAGGDPITLMTTHHNTLLAISAGAVFMGANTYIGNAPNFMVKSISESSGVKMPSFFGYLMKYSIPILIPLFVLVSIIFF